MTIDGQISKISEHRELSLGLSTIYWLNLDLMMNPPLHEVVFAPTEDEMSDRTLYLIVIIFSQYLIKYKSSIQYAILGLTDRIPFHTHLVRDKY